MRLAGQIKERGRSELGSKWGKAVTCAFKDYSELIIAFFLFFNVYIYIYIMLNRTISWGLV